MGYTETVVVNHGVLYLSKWLCIMVCNVEPFIVNQGELCRASGCESRCVMVTHWLSIMACYTAPVVVNHGV